MCREPKETCKRSQQYSAVWIFKKLLRIYLKVSVKIIENSNRFQIFSILVNTLKFHLKKMELLSGFEDPDDQNLVSNI